MGLDAVPSDTRTPPQLCVVHRFMRQLIEVKWDAKTQNKKARRGTRTLPMAGQVGSSAEDGSPTAAALDVGRTSQRNDELRRVTRVSWAAAGLLLDCQWAVFWR